MTRQRYAQTTMLAAALVCALAQIGCKTEDQPYSVAGVYTFAQDFEAERRVLRVDASTEQPVSCMETNLPAEPNVPWKKAVIASELHRALTERLFDEARLPSYQADLDAVDADGTLICIPRKDKPPFCYMPEVIVSGHVPDVKVGVAGTSPVRFVRSPLRFGLQEQVALSDEGRELIEAFLEAHEACWNSDD